MKILGKLVTTVVVLGIIVVGGAVVLPSFTHNKQSQIAMAIDNVNPLVKSEAVYATTTAKPVKSFIGGAGEQEYQYQLVTYNATGKSRTVTFDAQWKLKAHKILAISTKGQNVESWRAVATTKVPSNVRENLAMS